MLVTKTILLTAAATLGAAASIQDLINSIPQCAQPCLLSAAQAAQCDLSDINCLCTKQPEIQQAALPCLTKACTQDEIMKLAQGASQLCPGASATGAATTAAATSSAYVVSSGTATAGSNLTATKATPSGTSTAATAGAAVASSYVAGLGFAAAAVMAAAAL